MTENIRNFVIIAHIDHGKSTLADRFLELTGTVDKRHMKPQYLDQLELERERGITIKMAPVRMIYKVNHAEILNPKSEILNNIKIQNQKLENDVLGFRVSSLEFANSKQEFVLNLIDTPGHSDFSYEVSRALASVEGAILLVDATQGIQAQTLANFENAKRAGLAVIGAVNKIDIASEEQIESAIKELSELLKAPPSQIFKISGKTGEGTKELLDAVIDSVQPPKFPRESVLGLRESAFSLRKSALVFDSLYDDHKGIIAFVRVFGGEYKAGDEAILAAQKFKFKIKEVGYFSPKLKPAQKLLQGEIGYIATGIKDLNRLKIGDTIGDSPLPGYSEPQSVVFVSLYPDNPDQYDDFKAALFKLRLNDSSLSVEPDLSEVLGRGFRCGFLGQLHFEITVERLEKEFGVRSIGTFPFVIHQAKKERGDYEMIKSAEEVSGEVKEILEPIIKISIIAPTKFLGNILRLKEIFRLKDIGTTPFVYGSSGSADKILVEAKMPLSGLMRDFDSQLKSVSEGMASFSYEMSGYEKADLEKVEILVAGDAVPGLTQLMYRDETERESRKLLSKLKDVLPRQQFTQALQAKAGGRIIARENIPALRKDVTGYLYGGDRTRKMKLWKKQKKGKEKLKAMGRVTISAGDFKELLRK